MSYCLYSSGSEADAEDSEEEFRSRTSGSGFNQPGAGSYFVEGERSYNNTSWTYRLPADQEEVVRQDRQHYLLTCDLSGLYRGPVDGILGKGTHQKRILDVGCGTGIWLAEMAERWRNVDCVGIDVMPLQHEHQLHNCTYMSVEAPVGLHIFPDASFDVVHIRQMLYAVDDYPQILYETHRILRPDGIVLIHEPQFVLYSAWEGWETEQLAPAFHKWMALMKNAFDHRGINMELFDRIDDILVEAGFDRNNLEHYAHYRQFCPDDPSSESGQQEIAHAQAFVSASRLMILEAGEITSEGYDDLEEEVTRELYGHAAGMAGPEGGTGLLSPWGYWWARKI